MKDGIIAVDKPEGISSGDVVDRLKKNGRARKVGHMGTLDPFATGVLLCGINSGTRLSQFFLGGSKRYNGRIQLGVETDTLDVTGERTKETPLTPSVTPEQIRAVIAGFEGVQQQVPPFFSAVKHKGKPLYKYARAGTRITKPPREIEISHISVEHISLPFVDIDVRCSGGTYVRTLAHDIGQALGCGASLYSLRREECCGFSLPDAVSLSDLERMTPEEIEERIVPPAESLHFFPSYTADRELEKKIGFGRKISLDDGLPAFGESEFIKVVDREGRLAAVVKYDKNSAEFNYCCVFSS